MRTVRIKLYQFNELEPAAKEKAREWYREGNTSHDWWEAVYEDFENICATIGIEVDLEKTWFRGFSSQGDGASFTASVSLQELIKGIQKKTYLEHAPKIEEDNRFKPSPCTVDERVLKLITNKVIDVYASIDGNDRPYRSRVQFNFDYTYNECVNYKNIDKQLEELEEWVKDIALDLDHLLYNLLEKEYDYLNSDEAVDESIVANGYEFTKEGKRF